MINLLTYFFRHTNENVPFEKFSLAHISIIIFIALILVGIYKNSNIIENSENFKKALRLFLIFFVILEEFIYYYFFLKEPFSWDDLLPIYTCRIAQWAGFFALLFNEKVSFKTVNVYWGCIGGVLALISPDIYPYKFPHATVFCFFAKHFIIIICAAIFIFVDNYEFSKRQLKFMYEFANINLLVFLIFGYSTGSNAGYLLHSPIFTGFFDSVNKIIYTIFVFAIYNLLIYIIYLLGSTWRKSIKEKAAI